MKGYVQGEKACEAAFFSRGKYWHAYTNGLGMPVLFETDKDYQFAMNVIAQTAYEFPEMKLISFEIMSNHFHFLPIEENESYFREFFKCFRKRLAKLIPAIANVELSMKPIMDLNTLRNTIVYINRNGFVADPRYNPFSYPWGAGRYYFHEFPTEGVFGNLSFRERRTIFHSRAPLLPSEWGLIEGYIAPQYYCDIDFGMSVFRSSQHYFMQLCRHVESYAGIASEIDDGEFLADSELFKKLYVIIKEEYHLSSMKDLSKALKIELARRLRQAFRSSNGQISRILNLPQYEVDALFPLSQRRK